MLCPVCEYRCPSGEDWCPSCGSYLGLLKRRPRHITKCVNLTIALGLGFFVALVWQVFGPLYDGWPAGQPRGWFWCEFGLATFLVALGWRAKLHLREMRRRAPLPCPRLHTIEPEEQSRASSSGR